MKRNRREHGRILSVETKVRGDALAADAAAGATAITVDDAGDFDEDGGWLYIGTQTIAYTEADDDTGVISLADPLAAAGEQGDPVHVWSDLYDEVVDYQEALVELDGAYDNPEPVVAEVAEGVGELPEGDRGKAGESCTLLRVADDEWEVVGVGGRPRKSRSIRFEADDAYTIAAGDLTFGSATFPLSHRPINESAVLVLGGVPQRPTNYTIDYDAPSVTVPLAGWEPAGLEAWVHYAYRHGLSQGSNMIVPFRSAGWKILQVAKTDTTDRSGTTFDDSGWTVAAAPFGDGPGSNPFGWPSPVSMWNVVTALWTRRVVNIDRVGSAVAVTVRGEVAKVYWNGTLIGSFGDPNIDSPGGEYEFSIPGSSVLASNALAIRHSDDNVTDSGAGCYADAEVTYQ